MPCDSDEKYFKSHHYRIAISTIVHWVAFVCSGGYLVSMNQSHIGISFLNGQHARGCVVVKDNHGVVLQVLRYEEGKVKSATFTLDLKQQIALRNYLSESILMQATETNENE